MGRKNLSSRPGPVEVSRREFLASSAIVAAAALGGVSVSFGQAKPPVKVGFILPGTGPYAMESNSLLSGFRFFLREKQVSGEAVEIIIKDPGPNDEFALEALAELIAQKDVYFIVGPPSLKASEQLIHGAAGANRIFFMTNASVRLVSGEMCIPTGFRIRSNAYQCGYPISSWAVKNIGVKAFLCGEDTPEANEIIDFFAYGFERAGGSFVDRIMTPSDSKDFGKLFEAVKPSEANLVFAAFSGENAAGFTKGLTSASPPVKQAVIGPGFLTAFPGTVGLMKGIPSSVRTCTSLKDPVEFSKAMKEKGGFEVTDASRAAEGYDLAQIIMAATPPPAEEKDVERISKAIADMSVDGPRGKFTFDKNHEPVMEMLVQEWLFSGQSPNCKVIENLGPVKTPDFGCGRVGFQTRPESEIKDEEPVWEDKDQ